MPLLAAACFPTLKANSVESALGSWCWLLDGSLDGGECAFERPADLTHSNLPQDRPFDACEPFLLRRFESQQVKTTRSRRVRDADGEIQCSMEIVARVELLDRNDADVGALGLDRINDRVIDADRGFHP